MKSVNEEFNQRVWSALSRLMENRYHLGIGFSPTMDVKNLEKSHSFNKFGDLVVPLFSGDEFLGAIKIKKGEILSEDEVEKIKLMFNKVGAVLLEGDSVSGGSSIHSDNSESKKYSINLIGGGIESRHKFATEIHDTLGSWSFINWQDSKISLWTTTDLENLSNICVYVRDIFELTPQEQQELITLAKLPPALRPHLVVGSYRPLPEYVEEKVLPLELGEIFSKASVFVDQMPKDYSKVKEVLEMLIDGTPETSFDGSELT